MRFNWVSNKKRLGTSQGFVLCLICIRNKVEEADWPSLFIITISMLWNRKLILFLMSYLLFRSLKWFRKARQKRSGLVLRRRTVCKWQNRNLGLMTMTRVQTNYHLQRTSVLEFMSDSISMQEFCNNSCCSIAWLYLKNAHWQCVLEVLIPYTEEESPFQFVKF